MKRTNYQWYCEYDYDRHNDCEKHGCGYICRCGEITNAKVTKAPDVIDAVVSRYIESQKPKRRTAKGLAHQFGVAEKDLVWADVKEQVLTDAYFIERLYSLAGFYDKDMFEVEIQSGYYGQEIEGVYFNKEEEVLAKVDSLIGMSLSEKVEFILIEEYGHLLDRCKNLTWHLRIVDRCFIKTPNEYYAKGRNKIERYANYPLIKAVTTYEDGFYKVVDGYHRLAADDSEQIKILAGFREGETE
jgi:hypothetical protein